MGVRGLTTYARQHDNVISQVQEFPRRLGDNANTRTHVAIDAWAWVYEIWLTFFGAESVQGGHYYEVSEHVHDFVHAWRTVGLEPVFFWDGPVPLVKQSTFLSRRASIAAANSAFMRSSAASRASRSFQMECYPAPPLLGDAVRFTLNDLGVDSRSMPGEADSAVAEFAESMGGLAVSKDSDFFILCSRGQARARYVPLDTIEYIFEDNSKQEQHTPRPSTPEQPAESPADDGFEAVTTRKGRSKARSQALAAAAAAMTLRSSQQSSEYPPSRHAKHKVLKCVRMRAYSSQALAVQLRLPPALLPVLGSVIGNDYSTPTQDSVLFRHLQRSTDKIREACQVVHTQWQRAANMARDSKRAMLTSRSLEIRLASKTLLKASMEDRNDGHEDDDAGSEHSSEASSLTATPTLGAASNTVVGAPVDRVRTLIEATVNALLERADVATHRTYYVSDGEKEACIESIIESVAAYSLLTTVDSAHLFGKSRAAFLSSDNPDDKSPLALYRRAFEKADFPVQLVAAMTERSCTMTIAPEDPDQKGVHVGAAREIRMWVYAILFQVWGMDWARETMEEPKREQPFAGSSSHADSDPAASYRPRPYREGESADDVISVDTESSASEEVDADDDADHSASAGSVDGSGDPLTATFSPPEEIKPPPAVTEYVRKGDRLVGELVPIAKLKDLLRESSDSLSSTLGDLLAQYDASSGGEEDDKATSLPQSDPRPVDAPLLPLRTRLELYRHALHSNSSTSAESTLPEVPLHLLPLAASLRHIIAYTAEAAGESKRRLNWTRVEIAAAVRTGCMTSYVFSQRKVTDPPRPHILPRANWVQPTTRGIHLASTLQLMLESSHYLSSSLLLSSELSPLHTLFDGPLFQYLLSTSSSTTPAAISLPREVNEQAEEVLKFVLYGHEDDLGIDLAELRKLRKENKKKTESTSQIDDTTQESTADGAQSKNKGKKKKGAAGENGGAGSRGNAFAMLLDQVE